MTDAAEQTRLDNLTRQIEAWWKTPRFENCERPYSARQVATLRQSIDLDYPSRYSSSKMFSLLKQARDTKTAHCTFGALDPVQVVNQSKHLKCIYVSGWQCSSTASPTNEPGPDFADYPAHTVPVKVDQLFKAQLLQDRMQVQARASMTPEERAKTPKYDYMAPMIADADAGFGGLTSTMKLIQLFIRSGAAGIHIEDQRPGNKKCGHMGGKVVVSCKEHCDRLIACRLQADIMGAELVILARTDAYSAQLIDSNIDPVDQPFILGKYGNKEGTFVQAGLEAIKAKGLGAAAEQKWMTEAPKGGLAAAIKLAQSMGFTFEFDWEALRSPEGFYSINGGIELCAARARQYLRYADMLWMETPTPEVSVARRFSKLVKQYHPTKFLAYNLSPSFNWSAFKMTDTDIANFCDDLAQAGFVFQFITLAGFHLDALKSEKLARDFAKRKMIAYVEKIQRKEAVHKVDQLTHQKWSGAAYVDACLSTCQPDSSTLATSKESTENQFK